jgi:hypothetical protein
LAESTVLGANTPTYFATVLMTNKKD